MAEKIKLNIFLFLYSFCIFFLLKKILFLYHLEYNFFFLYIFSYMMILLDYFISNKIFKIKNIFILYFPLIFVFLADYFITKIHHPLHKQFSNDLKGLFYLINIILVSLLYVKLFFILYLVNFKNKKYKLKLFFIIFISLLYLIPIRIHEGFKGDEREYLINLYSIVKTGDLNLVNDLLKIDKITNSNKSLIPLNFKPEAIYSQHSNLFLLYFVLSPFYYIGGYYGVLLFIALLSAISLYLIFKIFLKISGDYKKSFNVIVFLLMSPVFSIYSLQIYPEIFAFFLITIFVYNYYNNYNLKKLLLFLIIIFFWFNIRFIFFSFGFMILLFYLEKFKLTKFYWKILILFAISLLLFLLNNYYIYGDFSITANTSNKEITKFTFKPITTFFSFIFDQEFGIFVYFPIIIYIFLFPLKYIKKNIVLFIILFFYIIPLLFYSQNWYGGFSPPFRLFFCIFPIILVLIYEYIEEYKLMNNFTFKVITYIFMIYTILINYILVVFPSFKYNPRFNGSNQILEKINWYLHLNFLNYFPSYIRTSFNTYKITIIYMVIIILYKIYLKLKKY